jgi:hypothetical protein
MSQSEIGRELSLADLRAMKLPQVVIVYPPGADVVMTFWLKEIDDKTAVFVAGSLEPPIHVLNFVRDGKLVDDRGGIVRVFEYLGAV